jgi:hypothetical protein
VNKIVDEVLRKLENTFLPTTEFPVGLESRVDQVFMSIENQSSKVSMVGIWGMGGLGKTTTAKGIYNKIHRKFVHRSIIENIRQTCESDKGYIRLQQQLLSDLFKTKEKIYSFASMTQELLLSRFPILGLARLGNQSPRWTGSRPQSSIRLRKVRPESEGYNIGELTKSFNSPGFNYPGFSFK